MTRLRLDSLNADIAKGWFQKVVAAADNSATLIHCSDAYLKPIGTTGKFTDNGVGVQTGGAGNACGGVLRGFEYTGAQGQAIIVLCSDSPNGAMNAYTGATINIWNLRGNLMEMTAANPGGLGLNFFADYLSYMVLHELMHAADNLQCMTSSPRRQF